jgi:hypothetical protein
MLALRFQINTIKPAINTKNAIPPITPAQNISKEKRTFFFALVPPAIALVGETLLRDDEESEPELHTVSVMVLARVAVVVADEDRVTVKSKSTNSIPKIEQNGINLPEARGGCIGLKCLLAGEHFQLTGGVHLELKLADTFRYAQCGTDVLLGIVLGYLPNLISIVNLNYRLMVPTRSCIPELSITDRNKR